MKSVKSVALGAGLAFGILTPLQAQTLAEVEARQQAVVEDERSERPSRPFARPGLGDPAPFKINPHDLISGPYT